MTTHHPDSHHLLLPQLGVWGVLVVAFIISACGRNASNDIFKEAHRNIYDSIATAQTSTDSLLELLQNYTQSNQPMGQMIVCRQLGKMYRDKSNFKQAINYHQKGLDIAKTLADTIEITKALNNVGTDYRRLGIYDIAAQFHYSALQLCMQHSDKTSQQAKKNRVVSLNGLGNVYLTLGNNTQADSVFREALKGEKELNSSLGQAINYANIASIFEEKDMIDSAWAYYRLSMQKNVEAESDLGVALCYTHYGQLSEKEHNYDNAITQYQTAYQLMEKNSDEWHWLESALALAHVYILQNSLATAKQYLDKALTVAMKIQSKEHLQRIYRLYYNIYNQQGDTANALAAFIKASEYQDSVVNIKALNDIQNMRINIERLRKQDELKLVEDNLRLERQAKVIAYIALIAVLIASIVTIALLWYVKNLHNNKSAQQQPATTATLSEELDTDTNNQQPAPNTQHPAPNTQHPAPNTQQQQFLNKVNDAVFSLIRQNKLDVDALANALDISRTQLNRKLLSITQLNTTAYVTQLRVNYAKRLLDADINMPVSEVAHKCGYDDIAYFSRIFKQNTRMSPSQYRKRMV